MKARPVDDAFRLLSRDMRDAWEATAEDKTVWEMFCLSVELQGVRARWQITGEGNVQLSLEEYGNVQAAQRNDDAVRPLRRLGWQKTCKGWEELA